MAETLSDVAVLVDVLLTLTAASSEEASKPVVAVRLYCAGSLRSISNAPRSEDGPLTGSSVATAASDEREKRPSQEESD
jgi:hypothetical protein